MNRNTSIAMAVASILGTISGGANAATPPTLAQAAAATKVLYVAGSSAAKKAVLGAVQTDLCGGLANALNVTSSPNSNFGAVSCAPASGVAGATGSEFFTVYYRFEGGSVTGVLPIANNDAVEQVDLTQTSFITCADANDCVATVTGTSANNGTTDTFGGAVSTHAVQIGISDVEPAALAGNNYPTPYSTTAWGIKNPTGVAGVTSTPLFDEVYGIYVNNLSSTTHLPASLSLSTAMLQNIFTKQVTDWSAVTDTAGAQVVSSSVPIVLVNRELGSGSRTATDFLIAGDSCQSAGAAIKEASKGATDYFATGDVLTALSTQAGGITYATIDNAAPANSILISIDGVAPSNLAAASGTYNFWVEAVYTTNPNSSGDSGLTGFFTSELQKVATAPHLADILANPTVGSNVAHIAVASNGNTTSGSLTGLGSSTIYVNPFSRSKATCTIPLNIATVQ